MFAERYDLVQETTSNSSMIAAINLDGPRCQKGSGVRLAPGAAGPRQRRVSRRSPWVGVVELTGPRVVLATCCSNCDHTRLGRAWNGAAFYGTVIEDGVATTRDHIDADETAEKVSMCRCSVDGQLQYDRRSVVCHCTQGESCLPRTAHPAEEMERRYQQRPLQPKSSQFSTVNISSNT